MTGFLEKIRQKPPAVRKKYALGATISLVLVMVFVWAVTLPVRIAYLENKNSSAKAASPLRAMMQNIVDSYEHAREKVGTAVEQDPFKQPDASSGDASLQTSTIATSSSNLESDIIISDPE